MFKLKEDLKAMLKSEDFLNDVAKRQGAVANMEKPARIAICFIFSLGLQSIWVDCGWSTFPAPIRQGHSYL